MGDIAARLYVSGLSGICIIQDTLRIHEIYADFSVSDARCFQEPVIFFNNSVENDMNRWDFGDGVPVLTENATYTFDGTGDFPVKLVVGNIEGCSDSIVQIVTVHPLPDITIGNDVTICPGVGELLSVEGGHTVRWRPSYGLDNPTSYSPLANPEVDTTYTATITDTLTLCTNSDEVHVSLQEIFITGYIYVSPTDTSVIIGDPVQFLVIDSLAGEREISYSWTPDEQINCTDCPSPVVQPLTSTVYTLEVSDDNQCEVSEIFDFTVEVTEEYRIGVAEAFTPNGDGINETIRVNGWGIKELIEFRIYNRAGKEVFFSNDINEGWDGTYNGNPQQTGTYQYYIKAEMWDDNSTSLNGTFTLLR
jgi:gliding motility-associated-like protein